MAKTFTFWADLEHQCPIDIRRIAKYYHEFDSYTPSQITLDNVEDVKEMLFNARANFDSMVTSLIQSLYDRTILQKPEDNLLFSWLLDNLGRFMKRLDEKEDFYLVKFDDIDRDRSRVGVSRLAAYWKLLKESADSLIFESIVKATVEYDSLIETDSIKKEPRTFLYILFQIVHVTLSIMGALTREQTGMPKKGMVYSVPTTWQSLMSPYGTKLMKEGYKADTGMDIAAFEEELAQLEGGLET